MVYLLILFGALFRIFSNQTGFEIFPPNFAPIAAMAFFGGYYLPKKQSVYLPLVAMLLSDLIIGFYEPIVMLSVYGCFLITTLAGTYLREKSDWKLNIVGILSSSFLFYLVTNIAVWTLPNSSYSRGLEGILQSLVAGIPFYKFTLAGDLFFNLTFFATYYFVKKYSPRRVLT